jgi:pimeloyl-ACP methyl ester carboxylesterase
MSGWILLASLLPGCAGFDAWTRSKVYRPTAISDPQVWESLRAQHPDVSEVVVAVGQDGEKVSVLMAPAESGRDSSVRVLYLHGTFRHAFQNLPKAASMQAAGLDVFLPDYRGWGRSSPRLPDEASIHEDAWAVWQALQQQAPQDGRQVRWVIFGHSMGSAVAARLASRLAGSDAYCALVLESALTSFSDLASATAGWLGRGLVALGKQRMALTQDIGRVDPPVWFIHGELDRTVPLEIGLRAFAMAPPPKQWVALPMGHSNLHQIEGDGYARVWRDVAKHCEPAQR